MSIDTYGLPSEQYEEFFEDNVVFSAKLYVKACQILRTTVLVLLISRRLLTCIKRLSIRPMMTVAGTRKPTTLRLLRTTTSLV
jgi:hypothetical protein